MQINTDKNCIVRLPLHAPRKRREKRKNGIARVFCVLRVLCGQEITIRIIRVNLHSSVDFFNVHSGLYR